MTVINRRPRKRRRRKDLDPTRTQSLRRRVQTIIRVAYAEMTREVRTLIAEEDALGLEPSIFPQEVTGANNDSTRRVDAASTTHSQDPSELRHLNRSRRVVRQRNRIVTKNNGKNGTQNQGTRIRKASPLGEGRQTRTKAITTNTRWRHLTPAQKIESFRRWLTDLEKRINRDLSAEIEKAIVESFMKGGERAYVDVKGSEAAQVAQDMPSSPLGTPAAQTRQAFISTSFSRPVSKARIDLIRSRSLSGLKGVTEEMSSQIIKELTDGLISGDSPRDIARRLTPIVGKQGRRAETIARTEIISAHAEGQLIALEELGVTEVGVAVEWSTAGDGRVCPMCEPLGGVVLKVTEAKGMLPRHPNCRCAWIPANVGERKDQGQKRTKPEIKQAIKTSVKEDASTDPTWRGQKKRIAKERPEDITDNKASRNSLMDSLSRLDRLLNNKGT